MRGSNGLAQFVGGRDELDEQPVVVFHMPLVFGEIKMDSCDISP
jgi:hypothetical protein